MQPQIIRSLTSFLALGLAASASFAQTDDVASSYVIRGGCAGTLPPQSLQVLNGAPQLGSQMLIGIDNPLGTQSIGSLPLLGISLSPLSGLECGVVLPQLGMLEPGAFGELMLLGPILDPLPGPPWLGEPVGMPLPIPPVPELAGFELHLQGVMLDPLAPGQGGVELGLTEAMTMRLGNLPLPLPVTAPELPQVIFDTRAFALQRYDDFGQPMPLEFIDDPGLVSQLISSVDPFALEPRFAPLDLRQSLHLLTFGGGHHQVEIGNVEAGGQGMLFFEDGIVPTLPGLEQVFEFGYGIPGYSSAKEKEKEGKKPNTSTWADEELEPASTKTGEFTEIKLIVYQDDPSDDFLEDYATGNANGTSIRAYESKGPNDVINHIKDLHEQCIKVKTLVFAVHGSPGSFRLGPKNAPFRGPSRVGLHGGQVSRSDFGAALKPYLAADADIKLFSCSTGRDGGEASNDGPQAVQNLANGSCATVTAYTDDVWYSGTDAETDGASVTGTPGGAAPTTGGGAAGDLDPCD